MLINVHEDTLNQYTRIVRQYDIIMQVHMNTQILPQFRESNLAKKKKENQI